MAQEPGSEKCVCVAVRRPLRVLRREKRETCTFEFVLVWVYFERKSFESGFRDLTLRCKVLRLRYTMPKNKDFTIGIHLCFEVA